MVIEKARILIVDDDVEILETISDILEAKGYIVVTARSGSKAIEQIEQTPFDIALIDIIMPGMNGIQLYREIKRINPETKVIMMTGYSVEDLVLKVIAEGAWKVLYKPLNLTELVQLVGRRG